MRYFLVRACTICVIFMMGYSIGKAQSEIRPKEDQIAAAVSPAPASMQAEASVLGYKQNGELTMLREGSNQLICLADDPEQSNFHVSCYHKDLEPFMALGRKLRAKGFSRAKVDSMRRVEIEAGTLNMPRKPMALYSLNGSSDSFDYAMGEVKNASPLYVVYVPFETEASTGLSKKPASEGAPWIMEPGTPWAHIMIMTGRNVGRDMQKEK